MICIIGARGFLGSNISQHLRNRGEEVRALSFRGAPSIDVINKMRVVAATGNLRAVLICGAAQFSTDDPNAVEAIVNSNLRMPSLVASVLSQESPKTRLLHFGTSWQDGVGGREFPYNFYASSKSAGETLLEHFASKGLPTISLRLHDTYGLGDTRRKLLNLAIDAIETNGRLDMTPGDQLFDLVHIRDVVKAVDLALELPIETSLGLQRFDVGPTDTYTVKDVIELLCDIYEVRPGTHFNFGALPYRASEKMTSATLNLMPGWRPETLLEDGLREITNRPIL